MLLPLLHLSGKGYRRSDSTDYDESEGTSETVRYGQADSEPDYDGSTVDYDEEDYLARTSPVPPESPGSMSAPSSPLIPLKRKRGRPRGKAKPKVIDFSIPGSIQQRHVRRDHVDEECEEQGVIYRKWVPLNPNQTSHIAVRDWQDDTVIPAEQDFPSYCIMCPKNRFLKNEARGETHYLAWHHKRLLVVDNWKLLCCKCSEVRSHGRDNSARNQHYHCPLCFRTCKTDDQLGTHMITQHLEVTENMILHLLKPDNIHRS